MPFKAAYIPVGATGHVFASLPMIGELVHRGVEITYFAPTRYRAQVERTGARFIEIPAVAARGPVAGGDDFIAGIPLVFLGEAEGVIHHILPVLEAQPPDVILCDQLALAGRLAAAKLKRPLIMVFTSYAPCADFSVCMGWPQYPDTHPARAAALRMAADFSQAYGVSLLTVREIFEGTGDFNISTLSRVMQPAGDAFGPDFYFAGAQIAPRAGDGEWTPPDSERPLLYTSLGSLFNDWPAFYEMLFPVVREMELDVLCAVGPTFDMPVPQNVTALPFVPQLDVLQKASGFITHAGTGSAMEALYFGVPCLCVPQMEEQHFTAERLLALGAACGVLPRQALTQDALARGIKTLLTDEALRARCKALSCSMHEDGGAAGAAEAVLRFMRAL